MAGFFPFYLGNVTTLALLWLTFVFSAFSDSSEQGGLLDPKPAESPADSSQSAQLTKKGKKKKTVSWPEESKLREYFYFELDETERGE